MPGRKAYALSGLSPAPTRSRPSRLLVVSPPGCGPHSRHPDVHAGGVAELPKHLLAIFPSDSKSAHVGNAQTGNHLAQVGDVRLGEVALHDGPLSPIHELRRRNLVVK